MAALLDLMQIRYILLVEDTKTFTRPIYAGNAVATVQTRDPKIVITVRSTVLDNSAPMGGNGIVEAVAGTRDSDVSSFVSLKSSPALDRN